MTTEPLAQKLALSVVRLDPTRVRSHENPEKQLELAASMKARGLLNPISVRQVGDHYEIIAGNRRFLAAQSLGWTAIDARVWPESTTATETELLALVDNLERDDFNPIDEAKALKALMGPPHNLTVQKIVDAIGRSQPVVSNALALLDLPQEVQEFISREMLSPGHARFLSRIGDKREMMRLAKVASEEGWTVRELERRVNAKLKKTAAPPPVQAAQVDPLAALWSLVRSKVSVPDGAWDVSYSAGGRWAFMVTVGGKAPASALASWAKSLGAALGGSEAKSLDDAPGLRSFTQDVTAKLANVKADDLIDDPSRMRRPKTDAEWADYLSHARQNPSQMYEWLHGAKSRLAESARGMTWKDMGVADPEKLAREIIEAF